MARRALVILAACRGRRFGGDKQVAPVGPHGETLPAYLIDRARRVGFERVVVVTRPDLLSVVGSWIRGSERSVDVVVQPPEPSGTVPALLAARGSLHDRPFAVINADDLYPVGALAVLHAWAGPGHAVTAFHLAATLHPGSRSVNRALCQIDGDGRVTRLVEAEVRPHDGGLAGREITASEWVELAPGQLVSVNAWAFEPSIWPHLDAAATACAGGAEVLLPVVLGALVAAGTARLTCLAVAGVCLGLTWPEELTMMQQIVAREVAEGRLPARL